LSRLAQGPQSRYSRAGRANHYAFDPKVLAAYPPADIHINHIGDLLRADIPKWYRGRQQLGAWL
jgi:hypothetical protein